MVCSVSEYGAGEVVVGFHHTIPSIITRIKTTEISSGSMVALPLFNFVSLGRTVLESILVTKVVQTNYES